MNETQTFAQPDEPRNEQGRIGLKQSPMTISEIKDDEQKYTQVYEEFLRVHDDLADKYIKSAMSLEQARAWARAKMDDIAILTGSFDLGIFEDAILLAWMAGNGQMINRAANVAVGAGNQAGADPERSLFERLFRRERLTQGESPMPDKMSMG